MRNHNGRKECIYDTHTSTPAPDVITYPHGYIYAGEISAIRKLLDAGLTESVRNILVVVESRKDNEHDAAIRAEAAKQEREKAQPFIDFVKATELKNGEMAALMRRNELKLDNLKDPMQKLAFTFYSEIAELSHQADVILQEYAESLRAQQEEKK